VWKQQPIHTADWQQRGSSQRSHANLVKNRLTDWGSGFKLLIKTNDLVLLQGEKMNFYLHKTGGNKCLIHFGISRFSVQYVRKLKKWLMVLKQMTGQKFFYFFWLFRQKYS
jgi:hypothetical protein